MRAPRAPLAIVLAWAACVSREETPAANPPLRAARQEAPAVEGRFHTTARIEETFSDLARRHPRWFREGTLGESVEGRRIPFLEISDFESLGPKVGMWIDGTYHGHELVSCEPPLAVAEILREEIEDDRPPEFLRRVVITLVPVINVDARRVASEPPFLRQRRNLAPVDDDGDGAVDEDPLVDLNGDGYVSWMTPRREEERPRLFLESRDQDGDGLCGEDPIGGVDLNRNFPVPRGPGDVPETPLQPETRAILRYWREHPGVEIAISYHTSAEGYVLPPVPIPEPEAARFERILSIYREATGLEEMNEDTHPALAPASLRGISSEWFYLEGGAVALTVEIMTLRPYGRGAGTPVDFLVHECLGPVEVPRVEAGSPFAGPSHVEVPVGEEVPRRHAAALIRIASILPLRP